MTIGIRRLLKPLTMIEIADQGTLRPRPGAMDPLVMPPEMQCILGPRVIGMFHQPPTDGNRQLIEGRPWVPGVMAPDDLAACRIVSGCLHSPLLSIRYNIALHW